MGFFVLFFEKFEVKNLIVFVLLFDICNCFEGVCIGFEGEYEEILLVVKIVCKKKSDEEVFDFFRFCDVEGNVVICYSCQKYSVLDCVIILCSVCGIFWYFDCLDLFLVNFLVLCMWKCFFYIDEFLVEMFEVFVFVYWVCKFKMVGVIWFVFSCGFINDGYIDVVFEEDMFVSSWWNSEVYGCIVCFLERGIRVDFLFW